MTTRTLLGLAVALALFGAVVTTSYSDSHTEAKPAPATETAPAALMAQLVGDWTAAVEFFLPGSTEAATFVGTTKFSMVMNNYLQQDFETNLSQPFQGRAIFAYDARDKKWQSTWIDSMHAHVTYYEPTWDEATKTWTGTFEGRSPEGAVNMRETLTINSKDQVTLVWYRTAKTEGAKEETEMRVVYTRKAD